MAANVWNVPPMSDARILEQPPEIWRAVELRCLKDWGGKVRQMLKLDGMVDGRMPPIEPGWLTWEVMPQMEDSSVPVRQLFTACVLAKRAAR